MKRTSFICLLLTMAMLLSLMAGCGGEDVPASESPEASAASTDAEILKAIELGFVSDDLQSDMDTQISYAEFCGVLDAMLAEARPECVDAWEIRSAGFHDQDDLMTRFEGMMVLFYAAECAGVEAIGFWESIGLEEHVPDGMDFWEGVTEHPLLPDAFQPYRNEGLAGTDYDWVSGQQYADVAAMFAACYSFGNGKTYFDFDENYMLNFGDSLTVGDAIRAAERLYETIYFATYVSQEQVSECGVTADAIELALQMPDVAWDNLPEWTGYGLPARDEYNNFGLGRKYTEEEIEAIALSGYNFVRVPLKFDLLFDGTDMTQVCSASLETLDDLLNWCAEYGIHVCFDLHDMPGFTTNGDDSDDILFWDEESQGYFVEFWRFMAERYQDVPSNLLSFNLLNEPHGNPENELTDELYSSVMQEAIDAVRAVSPDRLIIVSTLGVSWGAPVRGLADAEVAQGFSGYILADGTSRWPFYYINQCLNAGEGDIVLRGDFSAGTEITLKPASYVSAQYEIQADGTEIAGFAVDGEAGDGSGCTVTAGSGAVEGSMSDHYLCTVSISQDCSEIRIAETAYGYGEILGIEVWQEDLLVVLNGDVNLVDYSTPPILTIHGDGTVTAEEPESLRLADGSMIQEMLAPYLAFREETGVDFVILECGTNSSIPGDVACVFSEDYLSALDACGISWCCYSGEFGPLIHQQMAERRFLFNGEQWLREGHTYENVTENYIVDRELMDVYQKYMG